VYKNFNSYQGEQALSGSNSKHKFNLDLSRLNNEDNFRKAQTGKLAKGKKSPQLSPLSGSSK
jgi:hypothetical protein